MLHIDTIIVGKDKFDFSDTTTIYDIESAFDLIKVEYNKYNSHMVAMIDEGELLDDGSFIDRFGDKRSTDDLSTGCKAAILVRAHPDKRVAVIECGENAIFEIVTQCTEGHILMYDPMNGVPNYQLEDIQIDVHIDNYRFTSLDRLNYYFTDERFMPSSYIDLRREGIEYVGI